MLFTANSDPTMNIAAKIEGHWTVKAFLNPLLSNFEDTVLVVASVSCF